MRNLEEVMRDLDSWVARSDKILGAPERKFVLGREEILEIRNAIESGVASLWSMNEERKARESQWLPDLTLRQWLSVTFLGAIGWLLGDLILIFMEAAK
jgi:hypothetical protein